MAVFGTNPDSLEQFFGNKEIVAMWVADMELYLCG